MRYFPLYFAMACSIGSGSKSDDTAASEPSSEDTGPPWVPGGNGVAYLLDGETNNSLFTLELTNATTPPEGSPGFCWGTSETSLGELTVDGSDVLTEIGYNGLMDGVNRFEAHKRRNGGVWWKCGSHHRTSLPATAYRH